MADKKTTKPKMKSFTFQPTGRTAIREFTLRTAKRALIEGVMKEVAVIDSLPRQVVMKPGDVITLPEEDFDKLVAAGIVLSKKQKEKIEKPAQDKVPLYEMTDKERKHFLEDRPYEI